MLRNGPNGIIFSLLDSNIMIAIGKAMKVAKKIVQIDIEKPKTIPNRNINLISPPPKDSFLNTLSPSIFMAYITIKAPIPE